MRWRVRSWVQNLLGACVITNKIHLLICLFLIYRPGRLEVQIEISLPDENGRLQILQIHTNKMRESSFLAPDVNLQELGMSISEICLWYLLIHLLYGWSDCYMGTRLYLNYICHQVLIRVVCLYIYIYIYIENIIYTRTFFRLAWIVKLMKRYCSCVDLRKLKYQMIYNSI